MLGQKTAHPLFAVVSWASQNRMHPLRMETIAISNSRAILPEAKTPIQCSTTKLPVYYFMQIKTIHGTADGKRNSLLRCCCFVRNRWSKMNNRNLCPTSNLVCIGWTLCKSPVTAPSRRLPVTVLA